MAARAHPHGHPAPRHRRHRSAAPAAGRSAHARHRRDGRDRVGHDPGPPENPRRGLRRLPVQALQREGIRLRRAPDPRRAGGLGGPGVSALAKVLVVDGLPQNVKLLADLLAAKGYAVVTASSGPEALDKVEKERPDLVLLDVMMPEMSGYDVCRKIRENPATGILPVVMVTSLDPAQERIKGLEAGDDDLLTKPVQQEELLARL